jgi:signal transduction histidine kinase
MMKERVVGAMRIASHRGWVWGRLRHYDVLRFGYGAMIALLIFSAVEAYRIQARASQQSIDIYRHSVQEQRVLYQLRRAVLRSAIAARDFLLSPRPDRNEVYTNTLRQLQAEARSALNDLERMHPGRSATVRMRGIVEKYWNSLLLPLEWTTQNRSQAFAFVEREIVPRRDAAGEMIRAWDAADQAALQNTEAEFAESRRAASRWLIFSVGLSLLLGLLIARTSLNYSKNLEQERIRRYQEVERARMDLEHLSARLLEVQEEERKRLSRELHDEIGQALTALRLEIAHTLNNGAGPASKERLERARELAERTLRTVRNIALLLRPSLLDDLGLGPALQWLAEDFTQRTGSPCEVWGENLENDLPDAVKTCVYRVVQEALHNCETHAAATRVKLSLRRSDEQITVEIDDDGRGFDTETAGASGKGLGIVGMRERAALLGGTLDLGSSPGRGCRVTLRVPICCDGREQPRKESVKCI